MPDYLEECLKVGIYEVRIIHGKGQGTLLRTVHAMLRKLERVEDFHLADERRGSWGATIVRLKKT